MKISNDFGIVIRRDTILKKQVELVSLLQQFNLDTFFDESDDLVSIGPFFGSENSDLFIKQLEKNGLCYIDDFFVVEQYFPDWCRIEVFKK